MRYKWLYYTFLYVTCSSTFAFDPDTEIAKVTQTPFARNPETKYYAFPFVNNINFGYGSQGRTQDILDFKPIISFQLLSAYDLILRTIAPLYHQPNTIISKPYINGWGDLNPTAFISPARYQKTIWGIGPTLFIPTASNKAIGSGKWSLGPEFAIFTMPHPWVLGILVNNAWSFAGDPQRDSFDQFSLQYFVSYNFLKGWYLTSQPTITANWKAPGNQVWTIPFGIGGGKAFHYTDGGMTLSLQTYYNVIRPAKEGPNWTLQAKLEFDIADRKVLPI